MAGRWLGAVIIIATCSSSTGCGVTADRAASCDSGQLTSCLLNHQLSDNKAAAGAQIVLTTALLPVTMVADVLTYPSRRQQAAAAACNAGYPASCIDYQSMQQEEIQREADQRAWWRNQAAINAADANTNAIQTQMMINQLGR